MPLSLQALLRALSPSEHVLAKIISTCDCLIATYGLGRRLKVAAGVHLEGRFLRVHFADEMRGAVRLVCALDVSRGALHALYVFVAALEKASPLFSRKRNADCCSVVVF